MSVTNTDTEIHEIIASLSNFTVFFLENSGRANLMKCISGQ